MKATIAQVSTPKALAEVVRDCHSRGAAIIDYGRAHQGVGHPPPPEVEQLQLDLRGGIIDHYERDMTVRAAAGMTIGELRQALAMTSQFCPIDADDDMTIGEVITHNVYGPLRVKYGSTRDLLLGLHYVDSLGRDIQVGGRTVKNVAGYDVARFMVGSLGQFGIVHQATLRTYAIPVQATIVEVTVDDPVTIDQSLTGWMLGDAAPTAVDLRCDADIWRVRIAYFGITHACTVQCEALKRQLTRQHGVTWVSRDDASLDDYLQHQANSRHWRREAPAAVKLIVPPASTGRTCKALSQWSQNHHPLRIDALPAHGCVFVGGALSGEAGRRLNQTVTQLVKDCGGVRVWLRRPADAMDIAPFAPVQSDWQMLDRLRRAMDPHDLFNPRRFLPVEPSKL